MSDKYLQLVTFSIGNHYNMGGRVWVTESSLLRLQYGCSNMFESVRCGSRSFTLRLIRELLGQLCRSYCNVKINWCNYTNPC